MEMTAQIIDYIKRNRVSTTEVADCLGKAGVLNDVMPIVPGLFRVGVIKWVYAYGESNWHVHQQIINTEEDDIVFIEAFDCNRRAIIGHLVAKFLLLYRQAGAIICNAKIRDAAALLREKYPIWCTGFYPIGCFNSEPKTKLDPSIIEKHKSMYDGAIAVCDDCGVVIITKEHLTEDFLQKLVDIEDQEDIWFDRLDHYKENTFDIVCMKNYLKNKK